MQRIWFYLGLVFLSLTACATPTGHPMPTVTATLSPTMTPVQGLTYAAFVAALRANGATVQDQGTVQQPFFAVPGHILAVNGGRVEVHEYATAADRATEAAIISPDGFMVGATRVDWVAPPHFYQAGRILVLYTGADVTLQHLFVALLGSQFAGA